MIQKHQRSFCSAQKNINPSIQSQNSFKNNSQELEEKIGQKVQQQFAKSYQKVSQVNSKAELGNQEDFKKLSNNNSNVSVLLESQYTQFWPASAMIKKIIQVNRENFLICFKTNLKDDGKRIFSIEGYHLEKNKKLKQEKLDFAFLKMISKMIELDDILPLNMPSKNLKTFELFSKFCIIPFIGTKTIGEEDSEVNQQKIEIWPKAPGLISSRKVHFLKHEFLLHFHHIINLNFRIVLSEIQNGQVISFDLQLEQSCLKDNLEKIKNNFPVNPQKSEELNDIFSIAIENNQQYIFNKYKDQDKKFDYFIEGFQVLKEEKLIQNIQKILVELEKYLESLDRKDFQSLMKSSFSLFKIKAWAEWTKFRLFLLFEQVEKKLFEVHQKNSYYTFAPFEKQIKTQGKATFPFENVWKFFGPRYEDLDSEDKKAVCSLIMDSFTILSHEKEIAKEDYKRFDENPIFPVSFDCGGFKRIYIGDQYKHALTLNLLGIDNVPFGIKISVYNKPKCLEYGFLYLLNEEFWKKKLEKKKKQKYMTVLPIQCDYYLSEIMKKWGWKILIDHADFEKSNGSLYLKGKEYAQGISFIDQLENLITVKNVEKFF